MSTSTHAQVDPSATSEQAADIVVLGQREVQRLETQITRFVRGHARLSRIDQLTRWRDLICVRVHNLPAAYATFIQNRILDVAREARAPASDQATCTPNVTIMFTAEPQAVLDQIRSEAPDFLGYHFIGQREALATMTRPIQAWYVTATRAGGERFIDEAMTDPPSGAAGSRLSRGLQSEFVHVLILVNANDVADAPVGPISDYLAMLSLTEIRDETWSCGGLVTIMEHFSTCPDAPQELTEPDRAFLQGLYTMDPALIATLQRGHVARRMREQLSED
jgi:hypothetical protein